MARTKGSETKDTQKSRVKQAKESVKKPIKKAGDLGKKEYYIPLPDNKTSKFLNKKRHIIPKYFRESWQELRQVTWPNRKQTIQLTLAVFAFAIIFGVAIAITDYGLERLFREILL